MSKSIIEFIKIIFNCDEKGEENIAKFLKHLKLKKLNNDNGPTHAPKFGDDEVWQLITYFITICGDILGKTIFMPNIPKNVPLKYMKDTMLIAARNFLNKPQNFCCAAGDIIILRWMTYKGKRVLMPIYIELKIAKKPINGKNWVTGSIPKTTFDNFHGKTLIDGEWVECPHFYILVPKVINASRGKICIINANELRKYANTLTFTRTFDDDDNKYIDILTDKAIPQVPDMMVELNDWVAEQETEALFKNMSSQWN